MPKISSIFLILCASAQAIFAQHNIIADSRDGKSYKTAKIGSQTWLAENLNYNASGSKCYGENPANCEKYGRLYDWSAAKSACPQGWHLPDNEEWDKLYRHADGSSGAASPYESETAGGFLKAASGWNDNEGISGNGTDDYGFAALPGGYGYSGGLFYSAGYNGSWWSASERGADFAYYRFMFYDEARANGRGYDKYSLHSVRCLQD